MASSGAGAVRMYAEFVSVYRQATLMHAHATNHIYDTDRQDEDGNDTFIYVGGTKYLGTVRCRKE